MVKLDAANKRVIVGPREALGVSRVVLKDVNWIGDNVAVEDQLDGRDILVRVRSTRPPVPAKLYGAPASSPAAAANNAPNSRKTTLISNKPAGGTPALHMSVLLDAPEEGVAPGQAAVFYDPNSTRVLGGGWIAATDA